MQDLVDNALDLFDAMRENIVGVIVCAPFALLVFAMLWGMIAGPSAEVDYNAEYNARVRARQAAQHAERMDRYMITGRYTPQEAEEAIERNDAIISYWENR